MKESKECHTCNTDKPYGGYYKCSGDLDGYMGVCNSKKGQKLPVGFYTKEVLQHIEEVLGVR